MASGSIQSTIADGNDADAIDPKLFWRAWGARACGGAVVTASGSLGPAGFFALSATHLAQQPPSLLVTIGKSTSALATLTEAKHFAVNYLSSDQNDLAESFGGKTALKGSDRFQPEQWTTLKTGAPILKNAVGSLDCRLVEIIERFDTSIAIGIIVAFTAHSDAKPLLYFQGKTL